MKSASQTFSALAAVLLLGTSAAHSQSVGDILGKAKDIKNKAQKTAGGANKDGSAAKDDGSNQDGSASKDGSDAAKDDASSRAAAFQNSRTTEGQQQYILKMEADKRAVDTAQTMNRDPNYFYRKLTVNDHFPIKFTCDDAAIEAFKTSHSRGWSKISQTAEQLETALHYGKQSADLKAGLSKVKEIHFTTTSLESDENNKGRRAYLYSFNPDTGLLTMALITAASMMNNFTRSNDAQIDKWVLAHIANVQPLSDDFNALYARHAANSSNSSDSSSSRKSAQVKKWTCTWCHQSVQSAARPALDGCPRNASGQHAWHN